MESPARVMDIARSATNGPTRAMTSPSVRPAAHEAFSHSRICATLITGAAIKSIYPINSTAAVKSSRRAQLETLRRVGASAHFRGLYCLAWDFLDHCPRLPVVKGWRASFSEERP